MTAEEATRRVLLVVNPRSDEARAVLATVVHRLAEADVEVVLAEEDRDHLAAYGDTGLDPGITAVASDENAADGTDVVVVLGGDGTVLRAAERARASGVPLFGVNLGHVGFLAEAEPEDLSAVVDAIVRRRWATEDRMTLDVRLLESGAVVHSTWALNEISLEKRARERMVDVMVEVDGRPLSPMGLRRRRLRDADRLDRIRLLRRRTGRVAGGVGDARGPVERARPVRAPAGGLADERRRLRHRRGLRCRAVRRRAPDA